MPLQKLNIDLRKARGETDLSLIYVATTQQSQLINNTTLFNSATKDFFYSPYPLNCSLLFVDSTSGKR